MVKKNTITKPDLFTKEYGGNAYENEIFEAVDFKFEFNHLNPFSSKWRLVRFFKWFYLLFRSKLFYRNTLFLNFLSLPYFSFMWPKTIVLIHHIDWSVSPRVSIFYQKICFFVLKKFRTKWTSIVVVSEFWKLELIKLGFKNVVVVNNCINEKINVPERSRIDFLRSINLSDVDSYLYLGNAQSGKGWTQIVEKLDGKWDGLYIVSGITNFDGNMLPKNVIYRYFTKSDYFEMLHYADCTLLNSQFMEGWNRVCHESLSVGTPVIGVAAGGMQEMLNSAGQFIVDKDLESLSHYLKIVLSNRQSFSESGRAFVRKFDREIFSRSWVEILK